MHRIFLPASSISEGMRKNVCCFWENQDKVLDAMQAFANGWFERRHTGARAALETARCMCTAESPVDLLREYGRRARLPTAIHDRRKSSRATGGSLCRTRDGASPSRNRARPFQGSVTTLSACAEQTNRSSSVSARFYGRGPSLLGSAPIAREPTWHSSQSTRPREFRQQPRRPEESPPTT